MGTHGHTAHAASPTSVCSADDLTATTLNDIMRSGPIGSWQAGDGAAPVQLDDGSTLLLMGDSIIESSWVHNSVLLLSPDVSSESGPLAGPSTISTPVLSNCVSALWRGQARGSAPQSIWTPRTTDTFYWPSDGYVVGDQLVVSLDEIRATGDGGLWGFEGVDHDYAVMPLWDVLNGFPDGRNHVIDSGPWDSTALGELSVVHVDSDPSIVNFSTERSGYGGSYLARLTDLADPSAPWLWFDGDEWQDDPLRVVDIAPGIDEFHKTVINPVEHDGQWWAVEWGMGYGSWYAVLTAPEVTGPWAQVSEQPLEALEYLVHPFVLDGELVVGWSSNSEDWSDLSAMRPSFATVTS